jgi:ATP-dependent DNA ligase
MILPAPMLLHQDKRAAPFAQSGWMYELKFDGYRNHGGREQRRGASGNAQWG